MTNIQLKNNNILYGIQKEDQNEKWEVENYRETSCCVKLRKVVEINRFRIILSV